MNTVDLLKKCDELERVPRKKKDVETPFAELFATFPDDDSPRPLTEDEQFKCRQLEHKLKHGKE